MPTDTLEQRAARYFGCHDKPRRSIRLNNKECLIVSEHSAGKTLVMHYSEEYRVTGTFIKLTGRAMAEFIKALEEFYVAPQHY